MSIPRPEYPRPQLQREEWINLNGEWDFEVDNAEVGKAKEFFKRDSLEQKIIVPFCPESRLSGIGNTDYMSCVWYRRKLEIPEGWRGRNILLTFGAVDYHATVYINGEYCGEHRGGYTPFTFNITEYLKAEGNYITLCAEDDIKSGDQPSGKQSAAYFSEGCFYTRTTGIWQTVFIEPAGEFYIKSCHVIPDIDAPAANLTVKLNNYAVGCRVSAQAFYEGRCVGSAETEISSMSANLTLALSEKYLWELGEGRLYDLKLTVSYGGKLSDEAASYFGLRSVALHRNRFMLNKKSVFQRLVLDQGYYPDGIYTAPDDSALKADIEYSMKLGFNGARLHQKIFEPRYLYWADRLGYMVWGEHGNWGMRICDPVTVYSFLPEWLEAVERDFSHPSIIGWCPFNETWDYDGRKQYDDIIILCYKVTKAVDSTRPVIDTSGNFHVGSLTDIYDIHEYDQNTESYSEHLGSGVYEPHPNRQKWHGQPFFVSEYGGIKWSEAEGAWGYGDAPKTEEEFIERYKGLTEAMLGNPCCCGFCYTQLYDVEQEQNGLMTYGRKYKFKPEIFYRINTKKAASEE